ncbi:MAG: Rieske 2Fe-2S domain-containing protein [Phototrophicaceae bacterium]
MADFKAVARVTEFTSDEDVLVVNYGRFSVLLYKIHGEFFAMEDRCSHADVLLSDGEIDFVTCRIQCHKHGAMFDLKNGQALTPPAVIGVKMFEVKVTDQTILIAPK